MDRNAKTLTNEVGRRNGRDSKRLDCPARRYLLCKYDSYDYDVYGGWWMQAAMTRRRRTKIPCIICTNAIKLPEYVGQDYDGDLLCDRCTSLLHIKLEKWEVKQYKVLKDRYEALRGKEALNRLQEIAKKLSKE